MRTNLAEAAPMAETGVDLARECALWALPSNDTCAGVARRLLRQALERLGLPDDQIYDATLAVNELAANVYTHVLARRAADPGAPLSGAPELWLYRRSRPKGAQFVCKVFDPRREPHSHVPTQLSPAHYLQEHGRGLTIVKHLAAGWGCHLTRSRIGGRRSIPGKAVWFAMPLPHGTPQSAHPRLTPAQAAQTLQSMLTARGIPGVTRTDSWGESTLTIRDALRVHCRNATFTWQANGVPAGYPFGDITETAEQLVRLHEELALSRSPMVDETTRPSGNSSG